MGCSVGELLGGGASFRFAESEGFVGVGVILSGVNKGSE
jgi:hypothetical protein